MSLYEIDTSISSLLAQLEPDENGMLPENCDELFEQLQNLDMQTWILPNIAKIKDLVEKNRTAAEVKEN